MSKRIGQPDLPNITISTDSCWVPDEPPSRMCDDGEEYEVSRVCLAKNRKGTRTREFEFVAYPRGGSLSHWVPPGWRSIFEGGDRKTVCVREQHALATAQTTDLICESPACTSRALQEERLCNGGDWYKWTMMSTSYASWVNKYRSCLHVQEKIIQLSTMEYVVLAVCFLIVAVTVGTERRDTLRCALCAAYHLYPGSATSFNEGATDDDLVGLADLTLAAKLWRHVACVLLLTYDALSRVLLTALPWSMLVILFSLSEFSAKEMLLTGVGIAFVLGLDDLAGTLIMSGEEKDAIKDMMNKLPPVRDSSVHVGYTASAASFFLMSVGFMVGQMVTCRDLDSDLYYRIAIGGVYFTALCEAIVMMVLYASDKKDANVFNPSRLRELRRRLLIFIVQTVVAAFSAVVLKLFMTTLRYDVPAQLFAFEWLPGAVWPPGPWLGIPLFQEVCPSVGFNLCVDPAWLFSADWFSAAVFWDHSWVSPPPSLPPSPSPFPPPPPLPLFPPNPPPALASPSQSYHSSWGG